MNFGSTWNKKQEEWALLSETVKMLQHWVGEQVEISKIQDLFDIDFIDFGFTDTPRMRSG
jgi:hypothetical protein